MKTQAIASEALHSLSLQATVDEISAQYALLSGGMKSPTIGDDETTAAAYLIALDGFSSWVIKQSVKDILKGKVDGMSKTFMPSAPELAAYCEKIEKSVKEKAKSVERLLKADEEKPFDTTNKADSEKIAKLMAEYTKSQTQGQAA